MGEGPESTVREVWGWHVSKTRGIEGAMWGPGGARGVVTARGQAVEPAWCIPDVSGSHMAGREGGRGEWCS